MRCTAEQMHFAVLTTTVIYATYAGGVLFALLAFGRWSDAIGRRPVLLAGVVFALASAAVFLVADSVPLLLVARVLSGLSAGVFTGTATAAVIEAAPESWRTRAAAVATVANMGGLGIGPLLAGLLVEYAPAPLQLSFIVHIGLALLAGVAVLVVPETSQRTGKIGVQRLSVPPEVRAVFVVASLAAFAGFAVTGLFAAVAPSFVSGVVGIDNHAVAGLIAGSIFFASAVAQIAARNLNPNRAVAIGCAILVAGMVILAVALHAFVVDRTRSGRGRSGHRTGHQLQPRPGRGRRTHAGGPASRGQLHLLRRRLRGDLVARGRRRGRGSALGIANGRRDFRDRRRDPVGHLPGRHSCAGGEAVPPARYDRNRLTYGANRARSSSSLSPNISHDVTTRPSRPRWWPAR